MTVILSLCNRVVRGSVEFDSVRVRVCECARLGVCKCRSVCFGL